LRAASFSLGQPVATPPHYSVHCSGPQPKGMPPKGGVTKFPRDSIHYALYSIDIYICFYNLTLEVLKQKIIHWSPGFLNFI